MTIKPYPTRQLVFNPSFFESGTLIWGLHRCSQESSCPVGAGFPPDVARRVRVDWLRLGSRAGCTDGTSREIEGAWNQELLWKVGSPKLGRLVICYLQFLHAFFNFFWIVGKRNASDFLNFIFFSCWNFAVFQTQSLWKPIHSFRSIICIYIYATATYSSYPGRGSRRVGQKAVGTIPNELCPIHVSLELTFSLSPGWSQSFGVKMRCQVWAASAGTQRLKPGKSHGEDGSRQAAGPERICFTSLNISTFGAHNQ